MTLIFFLVPPFTIMKQKIKKLLHQKIWFQDLHGSLWDFLPRAQWVEKYSSVLQLLQTISLSELRKSMLSWKKSFQWRITKSQWTFSACVDSNPLVSYLSRRPSSTSTWKVLSLPRLERTWKTWRLCPKLLERTQQSIRSWSSRYPCQQTYSSAPGFLAKCMTTFLPALISL